MKTILKVLEDLFTQSITSVFPSLPSLAVALTPSKHSQFGHYQCNSAMKLGKEVGLPPLEIAKKIVHALSLQSHFAEIVSKVDIAKPGFINLTLNPRFLSQRANEMLRDQKLGLEPPSPIQKIIVEFSSPNTAKQLHVGHLRSTIIGDSIARLMEFLGHTVLRLNHIGDWGTPFGMLIAYLQEHHPEILSGQAETDLVALEEWYRSSKKLFDEDESFRKKALTAVVALQKKEPATIEAWKMICEISRQGYQEIYDLLAIQLVERGESFYNPLLPKVIQDFEDQKLITLSNGAKCVFLENFKNREGKPLPLIIQKSDGGYNYTTTELAAVYQRSKEEKANRIIVVTDAGQKLHFQMVMEAAEKVGYLDKNKTEFNHVTFGLVIAPNGKKIKTREGKAEKLIDLIYAAIEKAKEALLSRNIENISPEELTSIAYKIGVGAIKYADLSTNRSSDYVFNYDKMLALEGNTVVFLMYSYVRILGIQRKVSLSLSDLLSTTQIALNHPAENDLALHLLQFPEALQDFYQNLLPNRLTDYLYDLATKFNIFFRDCHVIGSPEQNSRLLLAELTARVLKTGLKILGIDVVERL